MAILNFGGWEHIDGVATADGTLDGYDWQGSNFAIAAIETTIVKHGGRSMNFSDLPQAGGNCYMQIRLPNRGNLAWSSGTKHIYFWIYLDNQAAFLTPFILSIDGRIDVTWPGGGTTELTLSGSSSASIAVALDTWHLVHVEFTPASSCSMQVNGGTAVTANAHGGTPNTITLGAASGSPHNRRFFLDSWVIADAALDYEPAVYALRPDGNGTHTAWTGAYTDVDEASEDDDTTYITTSAAAAKETVTLESTATAGVVGTIKAVKTQALIRDEGGASSVETLIRPGSTDYEGGENVDPGTSYVSIGTVYETNPDGGAWTAGALDATEIGVLNNNAVAVRCSTLALMVLTDGVAAAAQDTPEARGRPYGLRGFRQMTQLLAQ
jgi:hypothetical protein